MLRALMALGLMWALTAPAAAEVRSPTSSAFVIHAESTSSASPDEARRALSQVGRWWNMEHSYSADGRRLSMDLRAGGCFCERWGHGQSVEHARVVMVLENDGAHTIRLVGALGPLQDMALSAVLTFNIVPDPAGSKITMTYRVSGDSGLGLNQIAPFVDQVLMEQFGRLIRYTNGEAPA